MDRCPYCVSGLETFVKDDQLRHWFDIPGTGRVGSRDCRDPDHNPSHVAECWRAEHAAAADVVAGIGLPPDATPEQAEAYLADVAPEDQPLPTTVEVGDEIAHAFVAGKVIDPSPVDLPTGPEGDSADLAATLEEIDRRVIARASHLMSIPNRTPFLTDGESPLPTVAADRKEYPLARGCLDYFPDALREAASVTLYAGDDLVEALTCRGQASHLLGVNRRASAIVARLALNELQAEISGNAPPCLGPLTLSELFAQVPAALAEVAHISKIGNDQHNPGQPMHHARGKSTDHADCILRHRVDRGRRDSDGQRHSGKVAWRALAELQEELEREGAPLARGARLPKDGAP